MWIVCGELLFDYFIGVQIWIYHSLVNLSKQRKVTFLGTHQYVFVLTSRVYSLLLSFDFRMTFLIDKLNCHSVLLCLLSRYRLLKTCTCEMIRAYPMVITAKNFFKYFIQKNFSITDARHQQTLPSIEIVLTIFSSHYPIILSFSL